MKCRKCGVDILPGEERELYGEILCEDCYMDRLSPARPCDPWAVHSAKSFGGKPVGENELTPVQRRIIELLRETGGTELPVLSDRLRLKPADLERELAALRHMEKIRAELRSGKKFICLWDTPRAESA